VIDASCKSYGAGGIPGLSVDLERGLRQGLECLRGLGPARRMDAARLLAFLKGGLGRPSQITCADPDAVAEARKHGDLSKPMPRVPQSADAISHFPGEPGYPGMELNLTGTPFSKAGMLEAPEVLFHEMLHWLGYAHNEGVDVTYLTSLCCFPAAGGDSYEKKKQEESCDLLKRNPDWTSVEYQRSFAHIMDSDAHPRIAFNAAWAAAHSAPPLDPAYPRRRNTSALFESTRVLAKGDTDLWASDKENREKGHPFLSIIVAQAAMPGIPRADWHTRIQQFHDEILSA
jgi:hypothetical protein